MIMQTADSGNVKVTSVSISSTGLLRIGNSTATVAEAPSTQAMLAGVEYRIEEYRSGATLTAKAYRVSDNVLITTLSGTVPTTLSTYAYFGNNAITTGTLGSFTHDEMVIQDVAAEIGPVASTALSATLQVAIGAGTPASSVTGTVPFTVNATASSTGGTGTAKTYSFAWGDGTTTAAQASNTATHQYTTAGTRTVTVTVVNT